jgi:hypothetical protein
MAGKLGLKNSDHKNPFSNHYHIKENTLRTLINLLITLNYSKIYAKNQNLDETIFFSRDLIYFF